MSGDLFRAAAAGQPRRLVTGVAFAVLAIAASVLVARRLTDSSWPLANVQPLFAVAAGFAYMASFVFRARGWHRLFPPGQCPDQARCLASVGAAAASGAVLPFRLDYLVKVGVLRKLGGIRIGLEAIVLSIISLGMIDAIAMLPLAISATATSESALRGPLLIVVAFGVCCCTLLVVGVRLLRLPLLRRSRRLRTVTEQVARHATPHGRRNAIVAWFYLFACWSSRAFGSAALLAALGLSFSPTIALSLICLGAAAAVIPITSGGAVVNAGASAAILLALGVGKDIAINFSLASGLLLVMSALVVALFGIVGSLAIGALARPGLPRRGRAGAPPGPAGGGGARGGGGWWGGGGGVGLRGAGGGGGARGLGGWRGGGVLGGLGGVVWGGGWVGCFLFPPLRSSSSRGRLRGRGGARGWGGWGGGGVCWVGFPSRVGVSGGVFVFFLFLRLLPAGVWLPPPAPGAGLGRGALAVAGGWVGGLGYKRVVVWGGGLGKSGGGPGGLFWLVFLARGGAASFAGRTAHPSNWLHQAGRAQAWRRTALISSR